MKRGAVDYIAKPFNNEELLLIVRRALGEKELQDENVYLEQELAGEVHLREHHRQGLSDAGDLPDGRADRQGVLDGPR